MRKKILTGILGGFLFLLLCSHMRSISLPPSSSMMNTPSSAYVAVLNYNEYVVLLAAGEGKDVIAWNFSSSQYNVGITVMALDSAQYLNFVNDEFSICWLLSDGTKISDLGGFSLPYTDTWYLIFFNNAGIMQTTTLTYYGGIIYNNFGGDYLAYNDYRYFYFSDLFLKGDIIDWQFEGSNPYVGITVRAMDENAFNNFTSGFPYAYSTLSYGSYNSSSGTFTVPYEASWYFVFLNLDSTDQMPTDLVWNAAFVAHAPPIHITDPTSSAIWVAQTTAYIFYEVTTTAYVDIFLYMDGSYLSTLAIDQESTGYFLWIVSTTLYTDSDYQIYIQDHSNSLINDTSDMFTIENPNTLYYNDYQFWQSESVLNTGDILEWSFISSNPDVDIRVLAMDYPNFYNFTRGYSMTLYYTICYDATEDEGLFRIPYGEMWDIVFVNYDPDHEPTALDINVTLGEYVDDEYEENDQINDAVAISEGTYMDLAALDNDWYSINLTAGEIITIDLYFIHDDGDINLDLRDKAGNLVNSSATTTDHEHIQFSVLVTDEYHIGVSVSIYSSNPAYDMVIDVFTPSTTTTTTASTTTTTTTTTSTTTSTTDTNTSGTTTPSGESPFNISGYPFFFVFGAVMFGLVALIYWRKSRK